MPNILMATDELHKAFQYLNQHFFNDEIPEPAITIQSGRNRRTMGWCSVSEIWADNEGKVRNYELNISAEFLNIEFHETMDTIMHEMVHLRCRHLGIKDTSRNHVYHNKKFKEECLSHGFYFKDSKPDKDLGWAFPRITDETKRIIDTFPIDREAFTIARYTFGRIPTPQYENSPEDENMETTPSGESEQPRKSHILKWICPTCLVPVRSSKIVNIVCGDCGEAFILA